MMLCTKCSVLEFDINERVAREHPEWSVDEWVGYWERVTARQVKRMQNHCDRQAPC